MRRSLRKSIKLYFKEKIKKQAIPIASNAAATATTTISAATSHLISTCRRPRTPSFSLNINGPLTSFRTSSKHAELPSTFKSSTNHAATLSDVERFLFENFNSLFVQDDEPVEQPKYVEPLLPPSPPIDDAPPSKHYFMFSDATGDLNRKIASDGSKFGESSSDHVQTTISDESVVAMRALSIDPYTDFRRSMEEVMAARRGCSLCAPVDWDFMEELLLCYLDINDQSVHKYILEAFSDLAVSARRHRPIAAGGGRRKVREVVDV